MANKSVSEVEDQSVDKVDNDQDVKPQAPKKTNDDLMKVKTILKLPQSHPLTSFLTEVKNRGYKGFDTAEFVVQSLEQVNESWWKEQLEDFTPLEYKVRQALSDPSLREKLSNLLNDVPG